MLKRGRVCAESNIASLNASCYDYSVRDSSCGHNLGTYMQLIAVPPSDSGLCVKERNARRCDRAGA